MNNSENKLEWTGERYLPQVSGVIKMEHYHRYSLALDFCKDKIVLDLASGEGYGSNLISQVAAHVVGVDISSDAVNFAKKNYVKDNLDYFEGSATDIPFEDSYFDVVLSFETIEHHDKHDESMREFHRVLKSDGILLISSPNKLNYSDKPGYENPYHIKELYTNELQKLISKYFKNQKRYSQRVLMASMISSPELSVENKYWLNGEALKDFRSIYDIVIAGNSDVPSIGNSLYELSHETGLDHVERYQFLEGLCGSLAEQLAAEKNNAEAQIRYRDDLILQIKNQLTDEKNNAKSQIEYRDELIKIKDSQIGILNKKNVQ